MSLSATSTCLLNTTRNGDSTTSLGILFQCLITLPVKYFFLISNLNQPWCSLRLVYIVLPLVTRGKRLAPTQIHPPLGNCREWWTPHQPPFLQAKELQLLQLLLVRFDFSNKYYSCGLHLEWQQVIIIMIIMNTFRSGKKKKNPFQPAFF